MTKAILLAPRIAGALLALALSVAPAGAQGWSRTFDTGTSWDDLAWGGPSPFGGHLLGGSTDVLPGRFGDAAVISLDDRGTPRWSRALGTAEREGVAGAAPLGDGGMLLCGATTLRFDFRIGFVARVTRDGDLAWSRVLQAPTSTQVITAFAIDSAGGQGIAVAGSYSEIDAPPRHAFVMFLEPDGTPRWQRFLTTGSWDQAQAVAVAAGGGVYVAGLSLSDRGAGDNDAWIARLSADGDVVWSRWAGGAGSDEAVAVAEAVDGGVFVAGVTSSFSSSGRAPWILRYDAEGTLLWSRVAGDAEWGEAKGILAASGGGAIVTGRLDMPGGTSIDAWLASVDAAGASSWQRAFDSGQGDWGVAASKAPDGGLALAATAAWGFAEQDHWLLRLGPAGEISCPQARDVDVRLADPVVQAPVLDLQVVPLSLDVRDAGWSAVDLPVSVVTACDACADAGGAPPPEPSSLAGRPPLRLFKEPVPRLEVEEVATMTALNLYVDAIGSWYAPAAASGTQCRRTTWSASGGVATLDADLPPNAWVAVAASNACGESSAGRDSFGVERMSVGAWERCPPGP